MAAHATSRPVRQLGIHHVGVSDDVGPVPTPLGALFASGGVLTANWYWTRTVQSFPPDSGFGAFVVTGNYPQWVVFWLVVLGMVVGAIGSGTAASKFLDV